MATATTEAETRQKLLRNVKKEVKQIMEEAVTRKFVHEDSSHIVSFCAAVEACMLHGLKRRAAGFLRSNKVAALFTKVGKSFAPAEQLCRKAQELEQLLESKRAQMGSYSETSRKLPPRLPGLSPQAARHLWIRTALIEKVLDKIVLYLVENSSKYYEKEAVLMDPVDGPILASLLVGPCALEYTKMKTADHFWTDPSADELVQRHRIHSAHYRQDSPAKRPALCIQKRHSSSSIDERPSPSPSARDYVESLHQNSRATLLFGKNNVLVQPRDDMEAIPGYLSLHQTADTMALKWTPNQLMNGSVGDLEYERSVYWDYAMTIRLEEIVYLHCHQQVDSGGTIVLVNQDGIQRPPLRFPQGGHLLQFLSCLENGLLPHGQLDPPLWSQRGKGKVFPKLKKRGTQGSVDSVSDKEEDEATDYVFRIVFPNSQSELASSELMEQGVNIWQPTQRKSSCSQASFSDGASPNGCSHERAPLKLLCDNMKYQIISRAFYGWLAYCRHLSTVRTHLSALVNHTIVMPDVPCDAYGGLTTPVWHKFLQDCSAYDEQELWRLVYFGGIEPSLRKEVWPFLLGHYQFGMSENERKEVDEQMRACYEKTMSEWLGCEAIVRQREKEQHAVALAKCSSIASMDSNNPSVVHRDSSISNESSQSCSSERQRACLQSDSSSSTQFFTPQSPFPWSSWLPFGFFLQVFESVDEVEQIDAEPKGDDVKLLPKVSNSSDSGHPSSRNFSVTSGLSDSLSREDSSAQEMSTKTSTQDSIKEDHKKEETKEAPDVEVFVPRSSDAEKMEKIVIGGAGDESEKAEMEHMDTVEETLEQEVSEKRNEVEVGEHSEAGEGFEGIVPQVIKDTEVVDKRRKPEVLEEIDETKQEEKSGILVSISTGERREECTVGEQSKSFETGYSPGGLKTTESETLNTSTSIKNDESEKIQSFKAEPSENQTESRPKTNEAQRAGKPSTAEAQSPSRVKEKGQAETVRKKVTMPSAPVVKEIVVPVVFEAFSMREMSKETPATDSDESPSAIEMEEIPMARLVGVQEGNEALLPEMETLYPQFDSHAVANEKKTATSPVPSIGTTYSQELLDLYTLNLHRIDKDVQRCDRNYWYFTPANLEKLRNIMCSYVWKHLEIGYVQGMCDLLAPLLVILDDEALAFSCFTELMKRMNQNFPHGGAMDTHFANMRSLIQILDSELFELMHQNGDYTHFYFCYRWFLLDFKRELVYDDVFAVWESIWAAKHVSSSQFVLFIALALVEIYRDIILENNMDFTDIIKFFNEMAEHHNVKQILELARELVCKVQMLIENK
ncbi:small G protein signaling modulator 1 isoform X3 [Pangasianodon hypophthalmus]|uniref:small G protein signaling modulator 1 isoform X3 n=1 Tax=Pangasianodon hypophthalmus TaxID=310915 RepID=UPI00147FC8A6|nr:small G protein signaling modulator 1 isoform X3 [Pangasianodon hypophthalmus]